MMRIGLFGGTFNPVHCGHLEVARDVLADLRLDKVVFIPAAYPPHKVPDWVAAAQDRLAMLELALADRPYFSASDVELQRSGPSYTIDTVDYFKAHYHGQGDLFLIMGLDAFLEIDTWKSYEALFKAIPMVVMSRPDKGLQTPANPRKQIETYLQTTISNSFDYSLEYQRFMHPLYQPVIPLAVTALAISATHIRERLHGNQSIQSLVPAGVAAYIKKRGLYR
jgi:nicotinate-nucleotide adenylyltransferase